MEIGFFENIGDSDAFVMVEVNPHIMFGVTVVCS